MPGAPHLPHRGAPGAPDAPLPPGHAPTPWQCPGDWQRVCNAGQPCMSLL